MLLWHADGVFPKRNPPPLRSEETYQHLVSSKLVSSKTLIYASPCPSSWPLPPWLQAAAPCCARSPAQRCSATTPPSEPAPGLRNPAQHSWARC